MCNQKSQVDPDSESCVQFKESAQRLAYAHAVTVELGLPPEQTFMVLREMREIEQAASSGDPEFIAWERKRMQEIRDEAKDVANALGLSAEDQWPAVMSAMSSDRNNTRREE